MHDDSVPSEVDKSGLGNPEALIERLNRQLRAVGIRIEREPVKTRPSGGPPCFRAAGANYREWLAQASLSYDTLPYRLDMPAEPNYCHDCVAGFKAEMLRINACIFPHVDFETIKDLGEPAVVGVSRSPEVAPDEYPVYDSLVHKRRPE